MRLLRAVAAVVPPPQYLQMPSVGADVSDASLKYVALRPGRGPGTRSIVSIGELPIEEGVIERGNVKDVGKFAAVLKEVRKRTRMEFVRMSLPEEHAYLFDTKVKKGTAFKQVRGLLEFRLEENVPLPPRDVYFDYDMYELPADSEFFGVSVTAYGRGVVESYHEACAAAGLTPLAFEVEAQAIARAVLPPVVHGASLIVDCGKTRTGIGIVHGGVLVYTSTIDVGGRDFSLALRRLLGERPEEEFTNLKNAYGLAGGPGEAALVREALLSSVSAVKDEVRKRIEYWHDERGMGEDRYIETIVLCGGSANMKGMPEYFAETLGIDTRRADVWQNVLDVNESIPPVDQAHAYGYATAIGLALGGISL